VNTAKLPEWSKLAVSVLVLFIYVAAFVIAYKSDDKTSLQLMMGSTIGAFTSVIGYWLGSSSGSDRKTDLLNQQPPKP
jgi:hypothetical protein